MEYRRSSHAASRTEDFVFHQLIPYIGNKRKLLRLIGESIAATGLDPTKSTFADAFAGTGVVSRYAKTLGFRVAANDWEPYTAALNRCAIACNTAPTARDGRDYRDLIASLAALPGCDDWVTRHLCPESDEHPDTDRERMFYMRKNGMRIDAIRQRIAEWAADGAIDRDAESCLLAPLLFAACYHANTSGVFKGFHRGWGGQTGTALYRIAADLQLHPAVFFDNDRDNRVYQEDATAFCGRLTADAIRPDFVYLDPPYNQHPYAANYHVLNSIALWDKPVLSRKIEGRGTKSAIRTDWREDRRSAYNYRRSATDAYEDLLKTIDAPWVATSYSTDGMIRLEALIEANRAIGDVRPFMQSYKRYRVSSQRFSAKPVNVEFVLLTRAGAKPSLSTDEIASRIVAMENASLAKHPESRGDGDGLRA